LVSLGTATIDDARDLIAIPEKQGRVLNVLFQLLANPALQFTLQ